ncbi:MAG: hypothetical protein HY746_00050, partial [Elusimicrobia bacterium]|nr:hypothetical protein [Elusimicrobiota bacterium]
ASMTASILSRVWTNGEKIAVSLPAFASSGRGMGVSVMPEREMPFVSIKAGLSSSDGVKSAN